MGGQSVRGEMDITVGEKTYILLPSFEAIEEVEKLTGLTPVDYLGLVAEKKMPGVGVTCAVIWAHIKDRKDRPDFNAFGNEIVSAGYTDFVPFIAKIMWCYIPKTGGGGKGSGEGKSEATG